MNMSTKAEREKIAASWDKINQLLGLFPVKPRGNLHSRSWAVMQVNQLAGDGTLKGVESAIAELKKAANKANYESACVSKPRAKPQISKVFVSDISGEVRLDVDHVLNNLQAYFRGGVGNRTKVERQSEFARFFIQFRSAGIPIPTKGLSALHFHSEQFCDALFEANFLIRADIVDLKSPIEELKMAIQFDKEQIIQEKRSALYNKLQVLSKGDRGKIYRAAKHTFLEAAKLLN